MLIRLRQLPLTLAVGCLSVLVLAGLASRSGADSVRVFDFRATPQSWSESGFVEMVPPLRLPGRAARELETSVWLRLPVHGLLHLKGNGDRLMLAYPEGTEAVRVEVWQPIDAITNTPSYVADVRGVRFTSPAVQQFFVLKPRSVQDRAALRGFSWPRDDPAAGSRATRLLGDFLGQNLPPRQASQAAARASAQNACAHCHRPARPDARHFGEFNEVARGTDSAGLFQVQTVLSDHAPLESYAPREQNLADPAIEVRCGAVPATQTAGSLGPVFRCSDGAQPVGYLNVQRALAAGDARVIGLCRARRYLHAHMDDAGRGAFSDAFRACGI